MRHRIVETPCMTGVTVSGKSITPVTEHGSTAFYGDWSVAGRNSRVASGAVPGAEQCCWCQVIVRVVVITVVSSPPRTGPTPRHHLLPSEAPRCGRGVSDDLVRWE